MQKLVDLTGLSLSALCLAHCLVLPFAALLLPFLGELSQTEWMHWAFVAVAAPVGFLAVRAAAQANRGFLPVLQFVGLGLGLLLISAFDYPSHNWGSALTVAGALSLSWAHFHNWRSHVEAEPYPAPAVATALAAPGSLTVLSD